MTMATPLDSTSQNNPLLAPSKLPHGAPPLAGLKAEHFMPAIQVGIAAAKKDIQAIKNNPAAPTFENTIEALEFSGTLLSRVSSIFGNIAATDSNDAIREIEPEIEAATVKHGDDIMMDEALFARVKAVYDGRNKLKLSPEQKMLLEETYKGFLRSGALLDESGKAELREINEKLSELGVAYRNNVVKSTDDYQKVISDEADLAGIPERVKNNYVAAAAAVKKAGKQARKEAEEAKAKAALAKDDEDLQKAAVEAEKKAVKAEQKAAEAAKGKWLIKLSPPPSDIFEYCENRGLREEIYRANTSIAWQGEYDNSANIMEMVNLHRREAQLLGYADYPAFVLDDRMAKTTKTVMDLLEKNTAAYKPAAEAFVKQVQDFAKKTDGLADIKPWDIPLYSRKLKEKTFDLDLEETRPYFDLEKVLDGFRIHAEKLFNIKITEAPKGQYPVYNPDVKVYEVHDQRSGGMIGLFYADYYARPGAKNNGAWMNTFRNRGLEDGVNQFAIVHNVCNFDKPTETQPTLLSLREVETVFHEFGHGLHALLAEGNYPSLTGTHVKWDFVEMPSQLLENWTKEKEVLDTFAAHYKTGEKIPAELVKKINDMGNFDAAYQGLRQTFFGQLDMKWYTTDPATIKSVTDLEDGVIAKTWVFPRVAGPMSTSFGHIFSGGYSAGYYCYKWAEILDADIFEQFKKNGLYDRKTADRLRDTIFSKGGTVDPMELFVAMVGRKPDPDALFRREGLLPEKKKAAKHAPKHAKP
jgi:peptidyl-dipeptidase Dcp